MPPAGPGRSARQPRGQRARPSPRSRAATVVVAGVALVAIAAVVAFSLHGGNAKPGGGGGRHPTSPPAGVTVLTPSGATGFDPLNLGDQGNENSQYAKYAIDSSATSAWQSQWYQGSAYMGGLKAGLGLIVDMGKRVRFSSATVSFGPIPGANVQVRVGNSNTRSAANLNSMTVAARASDVSGTRTFAVHATGRYLVIWFTKLPPQAGSHRHKFMAQIFNIIVKGTS